MLDLAKNQGINILQASTSEVYGDPEIHPQTEEYWGNVNPIGTRSCYDEGKRCAETLFMDYHRQNKVDIKIVRIFNTYGPKQSKDFVIFMGNGTKLEANGYSISTFEKGNVVLEQNNGDLFLHNEVPLSISFKGKEIKFDVVTLKIFEEFNNFIINFFLSNRPC